MRSMRAFRIGAHRVRHDLQNELAALGWLWSDAREASLIALQLVERERRVEAHIFLCVLAYHLLVSIETLA
jgi:hypothetical protein